MSKTYISICCCLLLSLTGCLGGKQKEEVKRQVPPQVIALVDSANKNPGEELANGLLLNGCRIEKGDSTFTLIIGVPDKRFDSLTLDSIKAIITHDLNADGSNKLGRVLGNHDMGMQYECTLPDSTVVKVYFSPRELKPVKPQPTVKK